MLIADGIDWGWPGWNALAAIAQILGAAATFAAVFVALRAEWRIRTTSLVVTVSKAGNAAAPGWELFSSLVVSVVNHSSRPVKFLQGGALLRGGKPLVLFSIGDDERPLAEWDQTSTTLPHDWLVKSVRESDVTVPVKVWFYVQDITGRRHWCRYRFDPKPWLTPPPTLHVPTQPPPAT